MSSFLLLILGSVPHGGTIHVQLMESHIGSKEKWHHKWTISFHLQYIPTLHQLWPHSLSPWLSSRQRIVTFLSCPGGIKVQPHLITGKCSFFSSTDTAHSTEGLWKTPRACHAGVADYTGVAAKHSKTCPVSFLYFHISKKTISTSVFQDCRFQISWIQCYLDIYSKLSSAFTSGILRSLDMFKLWYTSFSTFYLKNYFFFCCKYIYFDLNNYLM